MEVDHPVENLDKYVFDITDKLARFIVGLWN